MPALVRKQLHSQHIRQETYFIDYTELIDAGTSQAFTLATLGAEDMQILGTSVEIITTFADAGSISNVVVDVGDGTDVDAWIDNVDVFGPTAATYSGGMTAPNTKASGKALTATFTATGAPFGDGTDAGLDSGGVALSFIIMRHMKANYCL